MSHHDRATFAVLAALPQPFAPGSREVRQLFGDDPSEAWSAVRQLARLGFVRSLGAGRFEAVPLYRRAA